VNLTLHPEKDLVLSQTGFSTRDGRCRAFGAGGEGYVPGEGVGAVLLKPLARALADGDRIHGVIRATALNHGGRTSGYTVPSARAQAALAAAGVEYDALQDMPDAEVVRVLTAVPGIGVWTAEIYAMFSLGRADAFAAGDLALQEAARTLFGLEARPSERVLRGMAEAWSPWRSVAARILWAWYRVEKGREGVMKG